MSSILGVAAKAALILFENMGGQIDFLKIERDFGITRAELLAGQRRIPVQIVYDMVDDAAKLNGWPTLGLDIGALLSLNQISALSQCLFVANTVEDAIALLNRYFHLFSEVGNFVAEKGSPLSRVIFKPSEPDKISYHQFDGLMMVLLNFGRYLGGDGFISVDFSHPCAPELEPRYRERIQLPIRFNQPETCLYLSTEWLAYRSAVFQTPNIELLVRGERALSELRGEADIKDQIRFILQRLLITGEMTGARVALAMNISFRSMQRKLKEAGSSYKLILEETRKVLALDYLAMERHTVEDVAFLVGYDDVRHFFRAFKQWTGVSPGNYRKRYQML